MTTALLTGFEPFGGDAANPSADAVRRVAARWDGEATLVTEILPVSFRDAAPRLRALMREHRPDVVIAVGLAGNRAAVSVERVALNLRDARIVDNDGEQPVDVPCVEGAPTALFSTLPVKAIAAEVERAGVPCDISHSAGTFVCNDVFFAAVDEGGPGTRAGFVHVPWDDDRGPLDAPALSLDDITDAVEIALRTALEVDGDLAVPGGAVS
jgi:pyroglutamyl-peptidase